MSEQEKKTTRKTGTRTRKTAPKAAKGPKQGAPEQEVAVSVAAPELEGNAAPAAEAGGALEQTGVVDKVSFHNCSQRNG